MAVVNIQCISAPSTVAVGQAFNVVLKTNHPGHPGQKIKCERLSDNAPDVCVGLLPITGDMILESENGVFTLTLQFHQTEPEPFALPAKFNIRFGLRIEKSFCDFDLVAYETVPITVTK